MSEFRMPSLGADMEAGTLVEWRVKPGDKVRRGDIVAVVETDKGAIEIEIFEDGEVEKLKIPVGKKVSVGTVLATVSSEAKPSRKKAEGGKSEFGAAAKPARRRTKSSAPKASRAPSIETTSALAAAKIERRQERVRASPAARKLSSEADIDLAELNGSGPESTITLQDVERALKARKVPKREAKPDFRRAIASAMARSNREIPHYYVSLDIDVSPLLDWLESENKARSVAERLLPLAPLIKAAALSLKAFPSLSGHFDGEALDEGGGIHIGVAIALRDGGLIAPAIHNADELSVGDAMARLRDLTNRARKGGLRSSEMADPTFTITSLGEMSADRVQPLIFPPQVAILGLGSVTRRPWAAAKKVVIRPVMTATLGADHRVGDGRLGGGFLNAFAKLLAEPDKL